MLLTPSYTYAYRIFFSAVWQLCRTAQGELILATSYSILRFFASFEKLFNFFPIFEGVI